MLHPSQKIKVNFYLDHPTHSYYEVSINLHKDTPHNIIASIFQRLYPPHLHSYSTMEPAFLHVQTGAILNPHKTYAENGITTTTNEANPINEDIRIRLKINVLPLSQLPLLQP
jgi:hypothetical protein